MATGDGRLLYGIKYIKIYKKIKYLVTKIMFLHSKCCVTNNYYETEFRYLHTA